MRAHIAPRGRASRERGAVTLQVAFALVALTVMSGLAVDLGVLWVARTQVQASADAAAIAGASLLGCNGGLAKKRTDVANAAATFATTNDVWGKKPKSEGTDVTFPTCPDGSTTCVRANVFRDPASGKPLPTIFMRLVGLKEQGVRGTATAKLVPVGATDCLRPFAIPDRWIENWPKVEPWNSESDFNKWEKKTKDGGWTLVPNPDIYKQPTSAGPGTGFRMPDDCATPLLLRENKEYDSPSRAARYLAVDIPRVDGQGGSVGFKANITGCNGVPIQLENLMLQVRPGTMNGPTREGFTELIAQDPGAYFDTATGRIQGGCMAAGTCKVSPRLILVPIYDPEHHADTRKDGKVDIRIVNTAGLFVASYDNDDLYGYFTSYPSVPRNTGALTPQSAFLHASVLIR